MSLNLANKGGERYERDTPPSGVDRSLVAQVITQTKDVNDNLGAVITSTERLIIRQNVLIGLCILALLLVGMLLIYVYDSRQTQELISRQMELVRYHMIDIENGRKAAGSDLVELQRSLDALGVIIEDTQCDGKAK